jgi:hypothetical protein
MCEIALITSAISFVFLSTPPKKSDAIELVEIKRANKLTP